MSLRMKSGMFKQRTLTQSVLSLVCVHISTLLMTAQLSWINSTVIGRGIEEVTEWQQEKN